MPNRFGDALEDLIPDALCAFAQLGEAPIDYLNGVRDGLLGTDSDPDGSAAGFESPIQKFLCGLGDNPQTPNVRVPGEVVPGACVTRYRPIILYTRVLGGELKNERFTAGSSYMGPIQQVLVEQDGNSINVDITFASGTFRILSSPFSDIGTQAEYVGYEPNREDGLEDDCGADNQPIEGGDPSEIEGDGNLDYEDENGDPASDPYTFKGGPLFRGPNGDTYAPFEVCFAEFCVNINFNVNKRQPEIGDRTPKIDPCCPEIDGPEIPEDSADPPAPDSLVRFAGVITKAVPNGLAFKATERGDGVGPSLYVPRIGVVRFMVEIGGRRTYTVDAPIKQWNQVTWVEGPVLAYGWTILAEKGFDITGTGVPVTE